VKRSRVLPLTIVLLVIALMSLGLLAACGEEESATTTAAPTATTAAPTDTTAAPTDTTAAPTSETTAAPTGQFDGEFVIGALGTMTGGGAMGGAEQMWAQQKAIDDINAKGGVTVGGKKYELKLKFVDDKSSETEAAAALEKLIKAEGLKIILSTQVSPINQAACIVAEKYEVLYHQVVTWTNFAREAKYKWCPDLFFSPAGVGEVPFLECETMPEAERPTKWGILTEDNADGQGLGAGVKEVAKKHPWAQIVEYQTYTPGTKDYSSVILKFKKAECDAIVVLCSPADGITFTKQCKEQDFSPRFTMGWKGFWPTQYMEGLGADSNYIHHDGFWSEDLPYPYAKELGTAYREAHNGVDSVSIGLPYAAVQILAEAINRADSFEPGPVRDEIYNGTFKGTTMGDVTYDAEGISDISPLGLQWMDGKRVIIYPKDLATGTLEWAPPWDER